MAAMCTWQCKGKTKAGTRCKKTTSNESGYCHLHENQAREDPSDEGGSSREEEKPAIMAPANKIASKDETSPKCAEEEVDEPRA